MNNAEFQSEQHRFASLTQVVTQIITSGLKASPRTRDEIEVILAATSLMRLALSYAKGIQTLLESDQLDAIPALHRALYEIWTEFRFLLRHGSATENAVKLFVNALLELETFLAARKEWFDESLLSGVKRAIVSYEKTYPEAVQLVRKQRENRKFHWSGLSRLRMERETSGEDTDLYRMLSWEAHAVISPLRDFEVSIEGQDAGKIGFHMRDTVALEPEYVAYSAGGMLFLMWNEYATYFGFPTVSAGNTA